jgi:hypothetical protein
LRVAIAGALVAVVWVSVTRPSGAEAASSTRPGQAPSAQSDSTDDGPLTIVRARLNNRDLSSGTNDDPIPLDNSPDVPFLVEVRNNTDRPIDVRWVRFELETLSISWAHYDLRTHTTVDAGDTTTIAEPLDFFDINITGKGYIDSTMGVYDFEREELAAQDFALYIEGDTTSTISVFVILMLGLTIICIIEILVGITRRTLPANRFLRAVMFAFTGAVAAVTIVVGAAVLDIVLMTPTTYVRVIAIFTIVAGVLGYLSPGPVERTPEELHEEKLIDLTAEEALARASGQVPATVGAAVAAQQLSHQSGPQSVSHESGPQSVSHESGPQQVSHESGGHAPPVDHASQELPAQHDSGEHTSSPE